MPMSYNKQLLSLIIEQLRPAVKSAASGASCSSIGALIRGAMSKHAQEIVGTRLGPSRYAASMQARQAARDQALQREYDARSGRSRGLTGNESYDSRPDVVAYRNRRALEARRQQYLDAMHGVKAKTQEQVRKETDAKGPVKSWGDNKYVRAGIRGVTVPIRALGGAVGSAALAIQNKMDGRGLMEGQGDYWKGYMADQDDVAHDAANGLQLYAGNVAHGAKSVGHLATKGIAHLTSDGSMADRKRIQDIDNGWANASKAHAEWENRVVGNYRDSALAHPEAKGNYLGKLNYGANHMVGQFGGQMLATGGLGAGLKGVGAGIQAGANAAATAVRGAQVAQTAGTMARVAGAARNMAASGIQGMGNTVAAPFNVTGQALTSVSLQPDKTLASAGRGAVDFGKGVYHTGQAVARPVRDIYGLIRHPVQQGRAAWGSLSAHPGSALWHAARYPGVVARDIAAPTVRGAWRAGKGAWNGMGGFAGMEGFGAAGDAMHGNWGGAAGRVGAMGFWEGAGGLAIPAYMAYEGLSGGGEE